MPIQGTSNIWPHYSKGNTSTAKEAGGSTLGQDDFLKILIAQLKHQDPMQPMQDRDFIAQMAQFSSVEQMMNMAGEVKQLRQSMGISSDLIGKNVSWFDTNDSQTGLITHSGVVDAITFNEGNQYAIVSGKMILMDEIVKIWMEQNDENVTNSIDDQTNEEEGK